MGEHQSTSWCSGSLERMGYNHQPQVLQAAIHQMFSLATSEVSVPGVVIRPVPLYEALNGKNHRHYLHRVEPSVEGGEEIARLVFRYLAEKSQERHNSHYGTRCPLRTRSLQIKHEKSKSERAVPRKSRTARSQRA